MIILGKLLASMKTNGSRVLIFSQMSRVLGIAVFLDNTVFRLRVSFSCYFTNVYTTHTEYCCIDSGTAQDGRISTIDKYDKPGSEEFIFLLTTRSGGLSINLTTVDIVVLYDSDW